MRLRFAMMLSVLVFTTCAAVAPPRPWKISMESSGGFAGRGNGSFVAESSGAATSTDMSGKSCSFQLTGDELARVEKLLVKAKPKTWKPSYVPENPCCDRFEWTLALTAAKETYETKWLDRDPPEPADLIALVRELHALRQRCRPANGTPTSQSAGPPSSTRRRLEVGGPAS